MPIRWLLLLHIVIAVGLVASCFAPWAYYPEIQDTFTGAYSRQNVYGKPYKLFVILSTLIIVLTAIGEYFIVVWAKIFTGGLVVAYGLKNFVDFSACRYFLDCPQKKVGLFLMAVFCLLMFGIVFIRPAGKLFGR